MKYNYTFCTTNTGGWLFKKEYAHTGNAVKWGKYYLGKYKHSLAGVKSREYINNIKLEVYFGDEPVYSRKADLLINA